MQTMNLPQISVEFHVRFGNLFIRQLLAFFCKEYLSSLCCVKAMSVEYKHIHFTFFQLAFTSAAI